MQLVVSVLLLTSWLTALQAAVGTVSSKPLPAFWAALLLEVCSASKFGSKSCLLFTRLFP